MNDLKRSPLGSLGYNFIEAQYLPKGKNEYYLRNQQNNQGNWRQLTAYEIEVLVRNRNTCDNWNNMLVSDAFNPELVQNCKFFGLVRIGRLEPYYLEFHNLRRPVGLYNSTIISSDIGNNVVVDNVNYLSHYIIGNDVMLVNINELATTDNAKFGNGILKQNEPETRRIWLEICNENGGRSVLPFNGMLPGDAWLWSRYRDDEALQERLKAMTEKEFDNRRGYYGKIGDRTVIKNCKIIKDVLIGTDAYFKGANKLKNLTVNSSADAKSQIGEGCELVNGIVGEGCRIFYGVKAVRFIMASHSQLKYGARLINAYLGNNSTISCCEVLNSLIFPGHEQHHNNSFLCAALVMGQSNMAAGATIGSNHNSRSPDGEIIAGRGFWPGLCVSLKHNSRFASFNILAKGDYPAELNIPLPFSLISNDVSKDELVVMPAYWFLYNMYALARNAWKYTDRDKRIERVQLIEYDYLAPDSMHEIMHALELIELFTGRAYAQLHEPGKKYTGNALHDIGKKLLLAQSSEIDKLEIFAEHFENSDRKARLVKVAEAYQAYRDLITYYAVVQVKLAFEQSNEKSFLSFVKNIPVRKAPAEWINMGGQLVLKAELTKLLNQLQSGKAKSWDNVHEFYKKQASAYAAEKLVDAIAIYERVYGIALRSADKPAWKNILSESIAIKEWITKGIYESRAKDYTNPFRKMVYENDEEMNKVLGNLRDNAFIRQELAALGLYKEQINKMLGSIK